MTDANGNIQNESDFYPYGGENSLSNNLANHYKFTGKERDAESGLDYFGARYYASSMGRFMSPDWSAKAEPVPYAKLTNPQSLNLYVYVGNSPESMTDPDGHLQVLGSGLSAAWARGGFPDPGESSPDAGVEQWNEFIGAQAGAVVAQQGQQYELAVQQQTSNSAAQQQNSTQTPDNTLVAQNNTPPPPGRTPAQGGTPGSTVEIPDGKGGKTVRRYGPDGKAETDIDHGHDHGAGDPHAHDWDWGKKPPRQPGRPLTPEEQKNVKRAAGGVTAGVIIYWIISEGSRLFPPRNLIPVP